MSDLDNLATIIAVAQGVPFTGPRQRKIAQTIINAGWTAPVTSIDIEQRVDEILANDDIETRHIDEDALYEELALARLTAEERVHIQRLQDADLVRWYA